MTASAYHAGLKCWEGRYAVLETGQGVWLSVLAIRFLDWWVRHEGMGGAVRHQERRGANPLWIRMPMQKSENSRFMDEECCSTMDLDRETAMAVSACVEMRDMYASRTTGTWE